MRKILSFILVCGMMMTIFTGCMLLDKSGADNANNDELTPASSVTMGEDEANSLKDKTPIQLYFINESGNKLSPETRYIENSDSSKGNAYLATVVLKELIKGPAKGSLLQTSIPQGTTVHADVTIKDGSATVDLSKEFIDKHPGGKKQEQLTLYSIVNTLTEIKDIKSVQFKIDGKVKKEFKGSYQIDVVYPRSAYLITANPEEVNSLTKVDESKNIQPSKQEPVKQQPTKEEPVKQEPVKQQPTKEEPAKQEPVKQQPTKEEPAKQEPVKQQPTKEEPTKQQPTKEEPTKQQPTKEEPTKQQPTKEEPTKQAPAKQDTTKDKKANSDTENYIDDVETGAEMLE
ncbi:MAG: GerMN domain-containing protein [Ruminiclostridium sp.]